MLLQEFTSINFSKAMKYGIYILILFTFITACSSERSGSEMQAGNSPYQLDTISPAQALAGTRVILYGKNFPDSAVKVWFGNAPADSILLTSLTSIEVIVPRFEDPNVQVRVSSTDDTYYSNTRPFKLQSTPQKVRTMYFTTHMITKGEIMPNGNLQVKELYEDSHPRGLQIDQQNNTAYWANFFGYLQRGTLEKKSDTLKQEILMFVGDGVLDVAWDFKNQYAYVCKENKIIRKTLTDTTKTEVLFKNRPEPFGISLSKDGSRLYWIENNSLSIYTANVSGGEPEIFLGPDNGLNGPRTFVIDEVNQKVYIGDTPNVGNTSILVYDVKDKSIRTALTTERGAGVLITDMMIDEENGYLYWMNSKGRNYNHLDDGEILRAPLADLSNPEVIIQPINWGHLLAF